MIEVNLPKCKDKRYPNSCAGFCFVQFARRCDAESAQKALNFSEFNGRKIAVDWSLEKDAYVTITSENACKYLIYLFQLFQYLSSQQRIEVEQHG